MAGYMPAQALLKTLLLTCASFAAGSVTEGDYLVLDKGFTNMCVLTPGAVPGYDTASMTKEQTYEASVDLFCRIGTDATPYTTFGTLRDAVIAAVNAAPCMSNTYFVMAIKSDGPPVDVFDKAGGGPYFVSQRLSITIQENV